MPAFKSHTGFDDSALSLRDHRVITGNLFNINFWANPYTPVVVVGAVLLLAARLEFRSGVQALDNALDTIKAYQSSIRTYLLLAAIGFGLYLLNQNFGTGATVQADSRSDTSNGNTPGSGSGYGKSW